jgi:hypothetical protein
MIKDMNTPAKKIDFDGLASQVEKRLDEIFELHAGRSKKQIQPDNNLILPRLDKLHKILLSIEFRDTDELLVKYLKQLEYLKRIFKHDKYLFTLVRLQYNLGIYIKTYKKNSHPYAFKMLRTSFNSMCNIFYAKNMKRIDRLKIINKEINQYNRFHRFVKNRSAAKKRKQVKGLLRREKNISENLKIADQKRDQIIRESLILGIFIKKATSDIKSYIRTEINKLRLELRVNTTNKKV